MTHRFSCLALLLTCSALVSACLAAHGGPSLTELAGKVATSGGVVKRTVDVQGGTVPPPGSAQPAALTAPGAPALAASVLFAPNAEAELLPEPPVIPPALPRAAIADGQGTPGLQPSCNVPTVADPSFSSTTVALMASDMKARLSEDCYSITTTVLAVCIPNLSLQQGCCDFHCARALGQVGPLRTH